MDLLKLYHHINTEMADVRTNDWALVSTPIPIILITLSYLYFVLSIGPNYMKNRPACSCLTFIKFYNVFQIMANACMVYHVLENGWYQDVCFKCVKLTYSTDRINMKYASLTWYFMCLKLIDYIETIVFVLRKKQRQISFLHLYHHVSIVVLTWHHTKYYALAAATTAIFVNSAVHVIMYTYYLLSSLGPELQRYTNFVKPMITRIQMVQFVFVGIYAIVFFFTCGGPKKPTILLLFLVLSNFFLFYNFYKETYRTEKRKN